MNRQKILIVDDSEMNREMLKAILGEGYKYAEAVDGAQALRMLRQDMNIDLVLLDINMPKIDGFAVLEHMNQFHWIDEVPVIMISAADDRESIKRSYSLGVSDYIRRPFDSYIVQRRVKNTLTLYANQKRLMGMVSDQIYRNQRDSNVMIGILSHIVEFRNSESAQHVLQVQTVTGMLLRRLVEKTDVYHLTEEKIRLIVTASALHDIGKISIPENILNKPGRLTPEEFDVIRTHPAIGASMLEGLTPYRKEPLLKTAIEICRWHHERWDGGGYPDGLRGDAESGERKDREQLRERAAADRRAVHRDKDRRPRDVQQGADVQQQIPRAVAVAGAVEIEQDLGEGVGQNDKDQSDGRDAHAQHGRGRDHAACTQCTDVVQQQERQERLKQVEHRVREHASDAEAVRGVQDEGRADQLRGNVQTDDAQQTAEHQAVPVVHLPLAGILPQDDQQHRHCGNQIMYVGCHSASPPSPASFLFKCASASAFHALMLRDFPSSSHRRLKPKVMIMRARGAQVRL